MSVLSDFERMRLYRKSAAEFEQLAQASQAFNVQSRYRVIARRYNELADMEAQSDKVRVAERLKSLRAAREEAVLRCDVEFL